jgi:hypothetical protein
MFISYRYAKATLKFEENMFGREARSKANYRKEIS